MSVKSKHSLKKESVLVKEKKKKIEDSDEDFETSEEELDLTKECHPIGYYMSDRAEMINQMFSVIKGNKLRAMLPPILKECDVEQLKLQCLDQLLGMSERRIACILEGEVLETSSESDIAESDQCENGSTSVSSSKGSNDSRDEDLGPNVDVKRKRRKKGVTDEPSRLGKLSKTDSGPLEQGKTLLEILELEMRARAIRALLKQSGNEKEGEQGAEVSKLGVNEMKEATEEIVDLTECENEEISRNARKNVQDENIDNKDLTFEDKIEKWRTEEPNPPENGKSRKLQAEIELRNKLFKKKIYRTRQQRMENEEEEKSSEKFPGEENKASGVAEVVVKQEPPDAEPVVIEDPEEGEISTSEDEYPMEIKQEAPVSTEVLVGDSVDKAVNEPIELNFGTKMDESAEIVTAIDNGTFVKGNNAEANADSCEVREAVKHEKTSVGDMKTEEEKEEVMAEETSWRDRWLRKDGVQKLVKSSKIYAKVKKRIAQKSQRAREDAPNSYETNSDSNSNSKLEMIEGSIEEYERLLGRNVGSKNENTTKKRNANESASEISENLKAEKT